MSSGTPSAEWYADKAIAERAAIRASAQTTETSHHNAGLQLVTLIVTLIGGAIGANVVSQGVDRYSSREREEAKERGRVAGAAIAAKMSNGHTTKEREALPQPDGTKVVTNIVNNPEHGPTKEEPTGNAKVDDERGEG